MMALNEYDTGRHYTKYTRHVNNSHETVDAGTVNALQDDINIQQEETNRVKDTAFEERVYTIFNNNLYANAMFIDTAYDGRYINMHESDNIATDFEKHRVTLDRGVACGCMASTVIYSVHGPNVQMNDFFLISNQVVPVGASVEYFIELHTGERWQITPNALKLPLHLSEPVESGFKIITVMHANAQGESPAINGYAVLYWDAAVEDGYGMTNPDLKRFP